MAEGIEPRPIDLKHQRLEITIQSGEYSGSVTTNIIGNHIVSIVQEYTDSLYYNQTFISYGNGSNPNSQIILQTVNKTPVTENRTYYITVWYL